MISSDMVPLSGYREFDADLGASIIATFDRLTVEKIP